MNQEELALARAADEVRLDLEAQLVAVVVNRLDPRDGGLLGRPHPHDAKRLGRHTCSVCGWVSA